MKFIANNYDIRTPLPDDTRAVRLELDNGEFIELRVTQGGGAELRTSSPMTLELTAANNTLIHVRS